MFNNHFQCVFFYIAGLVAFLFTFPIRISNYLVNLTKFKDT